MAKEKETLSREEEILLREVNEELNQDQQLDFFKKYGPWLGAGALLVVSAVAYNQYAGRANQENLAAQGITYRSAIVEHDAAEAPFEAAEALTSASEELEGGYQALAQLRAGSLFLQAEESEKALDQLRQVYNNEALPQRIKDMARLRAALTLMDEDPAQAAAMAQAITTEAFRPFGQELEGIAALAQKEYGKAYEIFAGLSEDFTIPVSVKDRAALLKPLADAGVNGIALPEGDAEAPATDAEAFIESFTQQLLEDPSALDETPNAGEVENEEGTPISAPAP
ncbi:MAG: tetratricopeptide repeat protein [Pseudomonadota bacterium]